MNKLSSSVFLKTTLISRTLHGIGQQETQRSQTDHVKRTEKKNDELPELANVNKQRLKNYIQQCCQPRATPKPASRVSPQREALEGGRTAVAEHIRST